MKLKHLKKFGQHFLNNPQRITEIVNQFLLAYNGHDKVIEIGPGEGALTEHLRSLDNYTAVEIDTRWAKVLQEKWPELSGKIINEDFLRLDARQLFNEKSAVIGNFPYNISSQIVFKVLENQTQVDLVVGMFQKEVADRVASKEGSKNYGILSVLTQHYYNTELLFDIGPEEFTPPPKVWSSVIKLTKKEHIVNIDYSYLRKVVKQAFGQRRKTLRNSLKPLITNDEIKALPIFDNRPEQLSLEGFYNLVNILKYQD